jgi:hypothetical protein
MGGVGYTGKQRSYLYIPGNPDKFREIEGGEE